MEQNFAGWITGSDAVLAPGKGDSGASLGRRTFKWQGSPGKVLSTVRGAKEQRSPIKGVPFGARNVYSSCPAIHRMS